jgi:hypothetical protein
MGLISPKEKTPSVLVCLTSFLPAYFFVVKAHLVRVEFKLASDQESICCDPGRFDDALL